MYNDFPNTANLIKQIARHDRTTTAAVQAANWYQTNYLPMAQAMYKRVFNTIKDLGKFDGDLAYWYSERLTEGISLVNGMITKLTHAVISEQICIDIKGILKSDRDPLAFMERVEFNCGRPGRAASQHTYLSSGTSNKKRSRRNYYNKKSNPLWWKYKLPHAKHYNEKLNERYPPQSCKHCAKQYCDNFKHLKHWEAQYKGN